MNSEKTAPKGLKDRVRNFSDSMFRNYQIMRKRWEISSAEKKRASEIARLGNMVFRLFKSSELSSEKIEPQIRKIDHVEREIKILEEKLRDIIMRADLPRQLESGSVSPEPKSPAAPEKPAKVKTPPAPAETAPPETPPAQKTQKTPAPAGKTAPVKKVDSGKTVQPVTQKEPVIKPEPVKKPESVKKPVSKSAGEPVKEKKAANAPEDKNEKK